MKVLSLLQPWASLVVLGHKQIETRSWNTKYRGPLLIHASAGSKPFARFLSETEPFNQFLPKLKHPSLIAGTPNIDFKALPFGAIIGMVNVVGTVSTNCRLPGYFTEPDITGDTQHSFLHLTRQEEAFGDYSEDRYAWLLSDQVLFKQAIPAKGKLGIWDYNGPVPEIVATLQERHQQQPQQ